MGPKTRTTANANLTEKCVMRMTNRAILTLAALALVLSFADDARAGLMPITYTFANYPSAQNGYTLTGTITTDGTIGNLSSADITAWFFSATNGSTSLSITSTDAGAQALVTGDHAADVSATATTIVLGAPFSTQFGAITLENSTTSYELEANNGGFSQDFSIAVGPGGAGWSGEYEPDAHQLGYAGGGTAAIATPEPASVTL